MGRGIKGTKKIASVEGPMQESGACNHSEKSQLPKRGACVCGVLKHRLGGEGTRAPHLGEEMEPGKNLLED